METVTIEKLVHGGQGIGTLHDGRKVFVWNALPGETVSIELKRKRQSYAEGVAHAIIQPSKERVLPKDEAYLSTSPWQIINWKSENIYKQQILAEALEREHVVVTSKIEFKAGVEQWQYRNKMEYSFWADENGLRLALFQRASHGKQIVLGSSIARPVIDVVATKICDILRTYKIRGSQLKTVVLRSDQNDNCVAALFVKDHNFPDILELQTVCQGLAVYYSSPKSPASIVSSELFLYGNIGLADKILGCNIAYDVNTFFQVNVPVFESVLQHVKSIVGDNKKIVDFYSGVGAIGIPLGACVLVDNDQHNIMMAHKNNTSKRTKIIHAPAEKALEYISSSVLVLDPPRAGLHINIIDRIIQVKPEKIIYLSCNPSTQARDIRLLQETYTVDEVTGWNFFPKTPHIESLAILRLKG